MENLFYLWPASILAHIGINHTQRGQKIGEIKNASKKNSFDLILELGGLTKLWEYDFQIMRFQPPLPFIVQRTKRMGYT